VGELLTGKLNVALVREVVTIEHAPSLVTADSHGLLFRDAGADHVPDCCPAEIVDEQTRHFGTLSRFIPGGLHFADAGAMITRRTLNVQPTIKVPAGYKFTVRVNRDILFDAPYQPIEPNPLPIQPPGQLHRRSGFSRTGYDPIR
jgi:hypothetical protein